MDPLIPFNVKDIRNVTGADSYKDVVAFTWVCECSIYKDWSDEDKNYKAFLSVLKSVSKICDDDVKVVYLDDDNDEIPIECDVELREALNVASFMRKKNDEFMALLIKKKEKDDPISTFVRGGFNGDSKEAATPTDPQLVSKKVCSDSSVRAAAPVDNAEAVVVAGPSGSSKTPVSRKEEEAVKFHFGSCPLAAAKEHVTTDNPNKRKIHLDEMKVAGIGNQTSISNADRLCAKPVKSYNMKYYAETPKWFRAYMNEFKTDILNDVKQLIDEKLEGLVDSGNEVNNAAGNEHASRINLLPNRTRNLMKKLEILRLKKKKLDQRMEKMESKKLKMIEKLTANSDERVENDYFIGRCNIFGLQVVVPKLEIKVCPLKEFIVTWKMRNIGPDIWADACLQHVASTHGLQPVSPLSACPKLEPGCFGSMSVHYVAPEENGVYESSWILFRNGKAFGPHFEIVVQVTQALDELPSSNDNEKKVENEDDILLKYLVQEIEKINLTLANGTGEDSEELTLSEMVDTNATDAAVLDSDQESTESKSSDVSFVVVPMPGCFFPDRPANDTKQIPVTFKKLRSSKNKGGDSTEPKDETVNENQVSDDDSIIEGAMALSPNELNEDIEVNESEQQTSTDNNKQSEIFYIDQNVVGRHKRNFIVRDKIKKVVYVDDHGVPFDLPDHRREVIFLNDPEMENTIYVHCDDVAICPDGDVRAMRHTLYYPHYIDLPPHPVTPNKPPVLTENCLLNPPIPHLDVCAPHPPAQMYPPPLPASPRYQSLALNSQRRHSADCFSRKTAAAKFAKHQSGHGKQDKRATDKLYDRKDNIGYKSKARYTKDMQIGNESGSVKHRLHLSKFKKLKLPHDIENVRSDKKKCNSLYQLVEQSNKFRRVRFDNDPQTASGTPNIDSTAGGSDVNNAQSNTPVDSDPTKQAVPVHILPEGLMNGAISAACSAYSTAVSALNSLRPRTDGLPEDEDEKLQNGLAILYEMGFTNTVKNVQLLKQYNYNIPEIVETYCKKFGE